MPDEAAAIAPAVWGFVGVIVGGIITVAAEVVRARNVASLDGAKRRDDRAIERDRFQLTRLEALQQAIDDLARVTVRIHGARIDASEQAGHWVAINEGYLDDALAEANRAAGLRVSALSAVILDDEVRAECAKALRAAIDVGAGHPREAADIALVEHVTAVGHASTRCGAVIRGLLTGSTER